MGVMTTAVGVATSVDEVTDGLDSAASLDVTAADSTSAVVTDVSGV